MINIKSTCIFKYTRSTCMRSTCRHSWEFICTVAISLKEIWFVKGRYTYICILAAAQMWMLAIYLPLIVGSEVPPEEPLWECFLLLIDILQISTARILSPGLAAYLGVLIHDHHNMFRHCYPTASIIPKMQYLVHFPSQILKWALYCFFKIWYLWKCVHPTNKMLYVNFVV